MFAAALLAATARVDLANPPAREHRVACPQLWSGGRCVCRRTDEIPYGYMLPITLEFAKSGVAPR